MLYFSLFHFFSQYGGFLLDINLMVYVISGHIYNGQSQNHQLPLPIDRFSLCPPPPQPTPSQPIKHFLINTHQD